MQMDMMTSESRTDPSTMMPIVKTLLESIFAAGELFFGTSGGAISSISWKISQMNFNGPNERKFKKVSELGGWGKMAPGGAMVREPPAGLGQ